MIHLLRFSGAVAVWFVFFMALWWPVARWTSQPVGVLAHMALEFGAHDWVRSVRVAPGLVEVETRLSVKVRTSAGDGMGDLIVEAQPQRYAYGLPLFLAFVFASGTRRRFVRSLAGFVALLPFQTFSLVCTLLKQIAVSVPGGAAALGIFQWQLEAIAFGYQLGSLLVPTLVPIVLWLVLDPEFLRSWARSYLRDPADRGERERVE